jgi:hypothetical protein
MKTFTLKFATILYLAVFAVPFCAHAAAFSYEANTDSIVPDQDFKVKLVLDTEGETVNAVEGTLSYPVDVLELKEVRIGDSSVNFWITRPNETASGTLSFSGITAGGFLGQAEPIFSLIFHTKKPGQGEIALNNLRVLLNDGTGSEAALNNRPLPIIISAGPVGITDEKAAGKDIVMPEDFTPVVASDLSIYDGKYFLVFAAQDKDTGIDHYEIREGIWGNYEKAESPYLLKNQDLDSKIYVKAVDRAGNERTVVVAEQKQTPLYRQIIIFSIILVVIIALMFLRKSWLKNI